MSVHSYFLLLVRVMVSDGKDNPETGVTNVEMTESRGTIGQPATQFADPVFGGWRPHGKEKYNN